MGDHSPHANVGYKSRVEVAEKKNESVYSSRTKKSMKIRERKKCAVGDKGDKKTRILSKL